MEKSAVNLVRTAEMIQKKLKLFKEAERMLPLIHEKGVCFSMSSPLDGSKKASISVEDKKSFPTSTGSFKSFTACFQCLLSEKFTQEYYNRIISSKTCDCLGW